MNNFGKDKCKHWNLLDILNKKKLTNMIVWIHHYLGIDIVDGLWVVRWCLLSDVERTCCDWIGIFSFPAPCVLRLFTLILFLFSIKKTVYKFIVMVPIFNEDKLRTFSAGTICIKRRCWQWRRNSTAFLKDSIYLCREIWLYEILTGCNENVSIIRECNFYNINTICFFFFLNKITKNNWKLEKKTAITIGIQIKNVV